MRPIGSPTTFDLPGGSKIGDAIGQNADIAIDVFAEIMGNDANILRVQAEAKRREIEFQFEKHKQKSTAC